MSSLDYGQAYRSHKGQASMAQHRASQTLTMLDENALPMPVWRGFQVSGEDGAWIAISTEYMLAVLSENGMALEANMARMKAGGVMKLNRRLYRWTDGE